MNKLLPTLALVLATGFAVPAFASDSLTSSSSLDDFDAAYTVQALQDKGFNVVDVAQDWNDRLRADVRLDNGQIAVQYFDANSLSPIGTASGNTRVLSKIDVGVKAPATSLDSLTYQGDGGSFK
jgi:hypothetical protein